MESAALRQEERQEAAFDVLVEPDGLTVAVRRPKTVRQLLNRLGIKPASCLVILRPKTEGEKARLLTPDLRVRPDDEIVVRQVTSRG